MPASSASTETPTARATATTWLHPVNIIRQWISGSIDQDRTKAGVNTAHHLVKSGAMIQMETDGNMAAPGRSLYHGR